MCYGYLHIAIATELEVTVGKEATYYESYSLDSCFQLFTPDRADNWASGCPGSQTSIPTYEWWNRQTSSLSWTLWARRSTTFATAASTGQKYQHTFKVLWCQLQYLDHLQRIICPTAVQSRLPDPSR